MAHDIQLIAMLAVLAGAVAVDTTAAFQIMVSQPLVAASLAGVVVGDPALGLTVGVVLQLVWVAVLPVGSAVLPDAAVAGVVGVGFHALLARHGVSPQLSVAVSVLVALGVGAWGQRIVPAARRLNGRLSTFAEKRALVGDPRGVSWAVGGGVLNSFLRGLVVCALVLSLAVVLAPFVAWALDPLVNAGEIPLYVWAAPLAAASMAVGSKGRLEKTLLGAGFAVGMAVILAR